MELLRKSTKRLLIEMSAGIVLYNLLLGILACLIIPRASYPLAPVLEGLLAGAVGAVLILIHMAITMERALDSQSESYASKTTVIQSLIRKIVLAAAMLFCWRALQVDLLAMVIGVMGLKAGAYLQPLVHKIFGGEDDLQNLPEPEQFPEGGLKEEREGQELQERFPDGNTLNND